MAVNQVITRLKSQLLTSGLSQKDQPLFQIINQLIDFIGDNANELNTFTGGGGGGGGGGLANADYLTHENNQATLPNSRQLIVGPGLSVNKTGSKFILSATGLPIREIRDEPEIVIPLPGPRGPRGLTGPQGPPGMDADCCDSPEIPLPYAYNAVQALAARLPPPIINGSTVIVNNSTTLVNINDLAWNIIAGEIWYAQYILSCQSATAADIKFLLSVPASVTVSMALMGPILTATTFDEFSREGLGSASVAASVGGLGVGTTFLVFINCLVNGSAGNSGACTLQMAQNTANPTNTVVGVGSFVTRQRLG